MRDLIVLTGILYLGCLLSLLLGALVFDNLVLIISIEIAWSVAFVVLMVNNKLDIFLEK